MNRIKILLLSALTVLGLVTAFGSPALAATNPYKGIRCNGAAAGSPVCSASSKDPLTGKNGVIVKATHLVALIAGVAAVIVIIIAGITFITSGGDSSKTSRARETIIYAAAGLVVIVLAQAIITFVVSKV
jgi:type IV secretion system pilin